MTTETSAEPVVIRVTIEITVDTEVVTGLTVDQWNEMTDQERQAKAAELWDAEAVSADYGGMRVLTAGAESL